jgi:hypothetical protein
VSAQSLGDVVCAFKSRVVNAYIARVKAGEWPPFPGKIWQRDYYERIVRNAEAEEKIGGYIRRNPWRCVMDFGNGLRGMGNPTLWTTEKIGVLASRGGAGKEGRTQGPPQRPARASLAPTATRTDHPYMSGFHSPMEKEVFALLLARKQPVIWCPAWSLENAVRSPEILAALEENRMLVLEMRNQDGNLAAAEHRNRFVLEQADKLWLPHVTPGGMLDRLIQELKVRDKILHNGDRSLPPPEGNAHG